jgi:NADPH:quinone reductase-like Zn-dependent oxidoreductase
LSLGYNSFFYRGWIAHDPQLVGAFAEYVEVPSENLIFLPSLTPVDCFRTRNVSLIGSYCLNTK